MPLFENDRVTGQERLSGKVVIVAALGLIALAGIVIYFMTQKDSGAKPSRASGRVLSTQEDVSFYSGRSDQEVDSVRKKAREIYDDIGDSMGVSEMEYVSKSVESFESQRTRSSNFNDYFSSEVDQIKRKRLESFEQSADGEEFVFDGFSVSPQAQPKRETQTVSLPSSLPSYMQGPESGGGSGYGGSGGSGFSVRSAGGSASGYASQAGGSEGSDLKQDLVKAALQSYAEPDLGAGRQFSSAGPIKVSSNSVPTGTSIPVVMAGNAFSSSLRQRVWAITERDVYFRRQLQLPKGVMLGGFIAQEPTRDLIDVTFDIMVFPDGTELAFSGFAKNPKVPGRPFLEGVRGLYGEFVDTPLTVELLPILARFGKGWGESSVENAGTIIVDGKPEERSNSQRVTEGVGAAFDRIETRLDNYLQRFEPYVMLKKGQPFLIELESTVDFSKRRLAGASYEEVRRSTGGMSQEEKQLRDLLGDQYDDLVGR